MKTKNQKKGFTIVELVIVIGVIGILTGILVPTFVNLSSSANEKSDVSFVKNANTNLAIAEANGSYKRTMHNAVKAAKDAGYDIENFKPHGDRDLVWDPNTNRFALVNGSYDSVAYSDGPIKAKKNSELFAVATTFDAANQKYSIYAGEDWDLKISEIGNNEHPLTVGFDVGENNIFRNFYYKNNSEQSVIFNTENCVDANLYINGPNDIVSHYGKANLIEIEAVASSSYHEFGKPIEPISITSGHIVMESGSDAVVEAKSDAVVVTREAGSAATVSYTGSALSAEAAINELRGPSFYTTYNRRTASLESVEGIPNQPTSDRNRYYENKEGSRDIYKIGVDNPLDFPLYASVVNDFSEKVYKNPSDIVVTFSAKDGKSVEAYYNDGKIRLGSDAVGRVIQFNATKGGKSFSFDFEAVNGYNATNALGLSMFDNRYYYDGRDGKTNGDPWAEKKEQLTDKPTVAPKALILHGDISVKQSDLPQDYFFSAEDLFGGDGEVGFMQKYARYNPLSEWTKMRNSLKKQYGLPEITEKEARRLLVGSMKDDINIYYRKTARTPEDFAAGSEYPAYADYDTGDGDQEFTFEGNYFTLDFSQLPHVYFFGSRWSGDSFCNPLEGETLKTLKFLKQEANGSNATLFAWNAVSDGLKDYKYGGCHIADVPSQPYLAVEGDLRNEARGDGGNNYVNNLTIIGNGDRANDDEYLGSATAFKVDGTHTKFTNAIITKTFQCFLSTQGYYYDTMGGYKYHAMTQTNMEIDRCKAFDSYNTMLYIYGSEKNTITNSCMIGAGGAIALLDERNKHQYPNKKTQEGYWFGNPCVDAKNVYFENYVYGTEPWFALKGVSVMFEPLKQAGSRLFPVINAHKTFTKKVDNELMINLIALDMNASRFQESARAFATIDDAFKFQGHFYIDNVIDNGNDSDVEKTKFDAYLDMGELLYNSSIPVLNEIDTDLRGGKNRVSFTSTSESGAISYITCINDNEYAAGGPVSFDRAYISAYMGIDPALNPIGLVLGTNPIEDTL